MPRSSSLAARARAVVAQARQLAAENRVLLAAVRENLHGEPAPERIGRPERI